jgi:nucleoside phosphorylase
VPEITDRNKLYGNQEFREKVRKSLTFHFPAGKRIRQPRYDIGPSATANVLLKNAELLTQWRKSARHLTHVEMEAGGVYQAARSGGHRNYPLLCVRGISDIVGFRRSPEWTEYACQTAASFVHALISYGTPCSNSITVAM